MLAGEAEEAQITQWFGNLGDIDINEEEDVDRLKLFFRAARAIMQYEEAQVSTALDEAEEQGKAVAELEDRLEQEREQYKQEMSQLRVLLYV